MKEDKAIGVTSNGEPVFIQETKVAPILLPEKITPVTKEERREIKEAFSFFDKETEGFSNYDREEINYKDENWSPIVMMVGAYIIIVILGGLIMYAGFTIITSILK